MARLIPARVHVDGDPANLLPGRRHLIHRMARKTEILPHAQRRFQGINRNVITVFTAPVLTPWLAQLLNHRMRIELWQASAYLLTAAPRSSTSQDPLRPLTQEHSFYLNLDFRRPGAQDSLHAWIQWLLELGASHQRAVHFIPVLYLLNRSPKHRWYHTPLTWTLLPGESLISTGLPLYVFPGVTLEPPRPDEIRRHQLREWSRERRVIVGDRKVRMRRMIEVIQEEPLLKRQLEVIATQGKDTMATLLTRVSAYVREISADFSPNAPRVWDRVITPFLRKNFSSLEFDQDGLDELRHLLRRKKRVLLVPSHRSHLDYILISYAIHKQGLSCPLVAAGKNLAFWPMGYFFRKTGAFFIRRTFKGLDIYPHVFRAYLWHIMHKFQPVEFFIEGGRSRTGALLPAKLGMLNMVLEAIRSGHFDDIIVVPMAVNYDRIPEEQSYIRELRGKAKQKERITGLLKNRHLLKRRFGKVHMATGQPLHIAPLLRDEASNIVQKDIIGGTIMDRIRKTMPVTACSLLAATAMARPPEQRTARVELIADAQLFLEIITRCFPSAHIAGECRRQTTRRNAWQEAFHRMTDFGNFISEHGDDTWRVNPRRRFQVDYLRNSLMGLLLPPALAAGYPESPEETSGFPALSQLMCPEIHPIPADILGMEIDHCRTVIPHLSRQQTELLECLLAPATALRCALSNALGHAGMSIDSISVTEWNRLFDSIAQETLPQHPEWRSGVIRSALYRSLKQTPDTVTSPPIPPEAE